MMIRYGLISELGEEGNAGYARVHFDDVDMVSDWLALPSVATKTAKHWIPIEVNSQVGCVIDDDTQQGFIAIVLWSDTDTPPEWASEHTIGMQFADSTEMYYDSEKHTFEMKFADSAEMCYDSDKHTFGVKFSDSAEMCYDSESHTLTVHAPDSELNITCKSLNVEGEVNIKGDTSVTGNITASEEVTAGTMKIKLTQHKHPTPVGVSGLPTP
jgi:phage baseplate assembly protein gpV